MPFLVVFTVTLTLTSCSKENAFEDDIAVADLKASKIESLEDELKYVRQATMRYHSVEQAEKAGYQLASGYVPQMGFHFTKFSLVDATFEMDQPEVLVYVPNEDGKLKLVAVEYAVPLPLSEDAPEGFTGDEDVWEINPHINSWTLHVWMPMENPDGIFAMYNPNVPVEDPSQN